MEYEIVITSRAQRDISAAADYITFSLKNPIAADDLLNESEQAILSLSEMPYRFALPDDPILASWGIRFVRVKGYLAFYQISEEFHQVTVVRFLHGKRDWNAILKHEGQA